MSENETYAAFRRALGVALTPLVSRLVVQGDSDGLPLEVEIRGHTVVIAMAKDSSGTDRLYIGTRVAARDRPQYGAAIGRTVGVLQRFRGRGGLEELRRWAPYAAADLARSPDEAAAWSAKTVIAIQHALGRETSRAVSRAADLRGPVRGGASASSPPTARLDRVLDRLRQAPSAPSAGPREPQASSGTPIGPPDWMRPSVAGLPAGLVAPAQPDDLQAELEEALTRAESTQRELGELRSQLGAVHRERDELRSLLSSAESAGPSDESLRRRIGQQADLLARSESERHRLTLELNGMRAEVAKISELLEDPAPLLDMPASQRPGPDSPAVEAAGDDSKLVRAPITASDLLETVDYVLRDGGLSPGIAAGFLERVASLAETPDIVARLGDQYLRGGRRADAIRILSALSIDELSPLGATALLEASLVDQRIPDPRLVAHVDWSLGDVQSALLSAPTWLPVVEALRLTAELVYNPPAVFPDWFTRLSAVVQASELADVFEMWKFVDEEKAAHALVEWIDGGRVSRRERWVVDGLLLVGIESTDRGTARSAFGYLVDHVRDTGEVPLADEVKRRARTRLPAVEWLATGEAVLRALLQAREGTVPTADDVAFLAELLATAQGVGVRSTEALDSLRALSRQMLERADELTRPPLAALLDGVSKSPGTVVHQIAPEAILTVHDAVVHVAKNHAGLIVLPEAERSARRRGSSGTRAVLQALERLGDMADKFSAEALDSPIEEALRRIPGYKENISGAAGQAQRRYYERTLPDKRVVMLGPHITAGSNGGRIYLFVDKQTRKLVVGHVGRHLPGRRDT